MAYPFTVDISAFYGEPDIEEQNSSTIVDRRKTLKLHKELEKPKGATKRVKRKEVPLENKAIGGSSGGAIAFNNDQGGATGGSMAELRGKPSASRGDKVAPLRSAGALAFNEAQLMNELSGLKKGGALGAVASTIIPALIQMAPQIISSLKELVKGKEGGALRFGGASAVFLEGIKPSDYDDVLKTMKAIERQSKNIELRGGALYAGSSRVGTFFKNAWNKIKGWYDNNAEKLKPITDILVNAGTNAANNAINKGVNYVSQKTGSDTVKQIANVIGDMAKNTVAELRGKPSASRGDKVAPLRSAGTTKSSHSVSDVADQIQGKPKPSASSGKEEGAGYDISDLSDEVMAVPVVTKKKNRIITALPQSENKMYKSVIRGAAPRKIRRRVY